MSAGKGKRRSKGPRGHELRIFVTGKILLTGPEGSQGDLRFKLARMLEEHLTDACPTYFGRTELPRVWGAKIARRAKFVVSKKRRTIIRDLVVDYQNRHAPKNWLQLDSDDGDTSQPGKPYK